MKPDRQRKNSDRRTTPRYRLSSPPEVEILCVESGTPVKACLRDLSQGGCFVETDSLLSLGTELTVTLKKSGDHVRAQARVVRAFPNEGLALAFTEMEGEGFRILDSWMSTFVATSWVEANRRRSQRVAMQIAVRVSGCNAEGARFTEDTHTDEINAFGGLVTLRTPVNRGQRLVLSNLETKVTVECMVADRKAMQVGLAFVVLNQPFWPIDFPPAEWSPRHPDAKQFGQLPCPTIRSTNNLGTSTNLMVDPPISAGKMNRAVVAFLDGQRLKGYILNFSPLKDSFKLFPNEPTQKQPGSDIFIKDLKAIFFVKDFAGNPDYKKAPRDDGPKHGRKIGVTFKDGEELSGTTEAYNLQKLGFFMFPLGKDGNNLRVFVINRNVRQVKMN
jgi:hypothetical protein